MKEALAIGFIDARAVNSEECFVAKKPRTATVPGVPSVPQLGPSASWNLSHS